MAVTDTTVTPADIIEKLGHLVNDARRVAGTPYYERRHRQINDALDDLEGLTGTHGPPSLR